MGRGRDGAQDETGGPGAPELALQIGSDRFFQRKEGSGTHYSAGFSAGGFTGSTSVATSNTVDQLWFNRAPLTRDLCGETDAPTAFTRVRTEA